MRRFKPALACTTLTFLLLSFVATPATASEPDEVSEEEITSSQGPSPYVEADTEEEAMRKLDAIEKEHPQGISAQAAYKRYGPCTLRPAGFHTRKSAGYKYGGVKPVTVCTKKVTGIKMASQLRVKNGLMWVKAGIEIPQTANDKDLRTGGKYKKKYYTVKFTQTNMKYKCKGTKKHKWSASSIGRLRYQGRTLWARVTSPILSVPCGPH